MSAIGDLVATMSMNTAPWSGAIQRGQNMLIGFAEKTGGILGRVKGSMGSLMGGLGMGVGFGALLTGAAGVKSFFMESIGLAQSSAREQKKLGILLGATGSAADLSAGQVGTFAEEMAKTTNYSKEATIAAASTMAVFKSRMSGDTFQGALKAAMDINSIMGGDLAETSRMVGLALADPIKGLRLMRKEGVLFTEEQKKQIQNAVAANDLAGAQQIMLGQVAATFGGDAQKMVSPMAQLKNQFMDISRTIGAAVLPYVKMFASGFLTAVQTIIAWVGRLWTTFDDVIRTLSEAWSGMTGFIGAAWSGAIEYLFGSSDALSSMWSATVAFMADVIHGLAFTFRNFGGVAKLALIGIVLNALEWFPQLEGPIRGAAAVFVASWAFVKTFFSTIVANIIGGLKEIWNVFKAVGAGISAAWSAMMSGDFSGIGSAFGDAFMKEFTSQVDVKAPNAFAEATKAAGEASGQFQESVASKGGMKNYLTDQQKAIQDDIAKNEVAFQQRREAAKMEAAKPPEQPGQFATPNIGTAKAKKAGKGEEGPKAVEAGSAEAWKVIMDSMKGGDDAKRTADATERTAAAAERTAEASERMAEEEELDW